VRVRLNCRLSAAALLLTALTLPFALLAQEAQPKPEAKGKITEMRVTGSTRYPESAVIAASGLKIGDVVGREELQAAADRLAGFGPFSTARYRFTSKGDAVSVEFQLEEAPTIPVWFDNFPWFTDDELTDGMKQAVALFDGTAPQQGLILDAMTDALQQMLASRNVKARVQHSIMSEPGGDHLILQFRVEGAVLRVNAVRFGDALASESLRLQSLVSELIGKPFSRFSFAVFTSEQILPLYLEKGFLRVKVGGPQARFTSDPNRPLPDNVLVIVPIEPGPVYHWTGVEWFGDAPASRSFLDPLIQFKPGDIVNGVQVIGLWHRVENEYTKYGFLEAKIVPVPVYDESALRVTYRVTVVAGVQYHMGEMIITGLSVPAEQKLRDAWQIPAGQIFNRVYFDEFLEDGLKKAFADYPLHYAKVGHWLRENPATHTVDVLLDFQ
jgi:outer membrane protein assembly factor BamA